MCRDAFANVAGNLPGYDAIWGAIYALTVDETGGVPRPGQLQEIARIEQILANDPSNTLQIGHFVKTAVALASPFDPALSAGADFDYYLRMWSAHQCVKIPRPFYYQRFDGRVDTVDSAAAGDARKAVERVNSDKCAALDFHADFTYRGEDFRFYVVNPFDLIHRHFLKGRFFEIAELAFVEGWVGRDAAIVEVGAYVGNHVVYYARFMRPRSILVLEPNPAAIALLRRNLEANAVTAVDLSRLGVGVAAAVASYDLVSAGAANGGATRLVPAAVGTVKSVPLDAMVEHKVDFIKIDVEGMELDVLAGAARVIAVSRPKIMIEVFKTQIPDFDEWLRQHGYGITHRFDYVHAVNYMIEPADA